MGKITRDAFLYMDGDSDDFAQCKTCRDFDAEAGRCNILGPKVEIEAEDSCGAYVQGSFDQEDRPRAMVTAEEVGLVHREVRCENCRFGGADCALYEMLNKKLPLLFELNTKISPRSCCNAQQPKRRAG